MDLEWDGGSARRWYRTFCDGVLGEYSLAYLVAELEERGVVVLEDFEDQAVGAFPSRWEWRGWVPWTTGRTGDERETA